MVISINNIDKQEWNAFVDASKWGDILQYWQWGEVKRGEGWVPYYVQSVSGKVRSMCLVKKAPLFGNVLYIPHGPIFQSVEDLKSEIGPWKESLLKLAKEIGAFVIEIEPKIGFIPEDAEKNTPEQIKNFENLAHFYDKEIIEIFTSAGFNITGKNTQPKYKLLYDLSLSDDELMALMDKNTRYNVRYAAKKGVVVKEYFPDDPNIESKIKQFYDLLLEMQKRAKGYPVRPYSSFVKLFEVFKGTKNLSMFEASFNGEVIIMTISPRTGTWSSSFYAGSNRLYPNLKATYLIRWAAVQKAKEFGCKVYDFWGIIPHSAQHKGYSDNKLSFGGARIDHIGTLQMPLNKSKTKLFDRISPVRVKTGKFKRLLS